jgi:hypothetical protein
LVQGACTGANAQWPDMAGCMSACATVPAANPTMVTSGNTIFCRFYHASVASTSAANAAIHCAHAGPQAASVGMPCAAANPPRSSAFTASASFFLVALLAFLAFNL